MPAFSRTFRFHAMFPSSIFWCGLSSIYHQDHVIVSIRNTADLLTVHIGNNLHGYHNTADLLTAHIGNNLHGYHKQQCTQQRCLTQADCRQSRSDWPSFSHALAACVTADQQDCTGAMYNHLISQYKLELFVYNGSTNHFHIRVTKFADVHVSIWQ